MPKYAARFEQFVSFLDEVDIQVGCPGVGLEVLLGKSLEFFAERFLAHIRRVADDDVEPAFLHHFREGLLPGLGAQAVGVVDIGQQRQLLSSVQCPQHQVQACHLHRLLVLVHPEDARLHQFQPPQVIAEIPFLPSSPIFPGLLRGNGGGAPTRRGVGGGGQGRWGQGLVPHICHKPVQRVEGFDQERARAARHIQDARRFGRVVAVLVQIAADGLLDDVFGHECRRVIDPLALPLGPFFFHVGSRIEW